MPRCRIFGRKTRVKLSHSGYAANGRDGLIAGNGETGLKGSSGSWR